MISFLQNLINLSLNYSKTQRQMNLTEIKDKYRKILQDSESDRQQENYSKVSYSQMKDKRKKHILTQTSCNTKYMTENYDNVLLKTKQKLAQSILNINKKQKQIENLKKDKKKTQQQNKFLKGQIHQLTTQIQTSQKKNTELKVEIQNLQQQLQIHNKTIESHILDKQLMQQQIHFYYNQVQNSKQKVIIERRKKQEIKKESSKYDKIRNQNERLREDIKRLHYLLEQSSIQRFSKLPSRIQNCHYLGKPQKQSDLWFHQDLIGQTEYFLKKSNVCNSKAFQEILVKFIDKQIKRNQKQNAMRYKRAQQNKKKQSKRKHNQSLCLHEILNNTSLGRSHLVTGLLNKSRRLSQSKKYTEHLLYDKLENSLLIHQINQGRKICIELFEEFKRALTLFIEQKPLKKKKIIRLTNWIYDSVLELFSSTTYHQNQTITTKITQ